MFFKLVAMQPTREEFVHHVKKQLHAKVVCECIYVVRDLKRKKPKNEIRERDDFFNELLILKLC